MNPPKISIGCVANLYSRQMYFEKAGDVEIGHAHNFDHLSLLAYGSVICIVDGKESRFFAPTMIYIKKDKVHELTAMEDETVVYCIHALRDGDGVNDIIDPESIPAGVNVLDIAKPIIPDGA